MIESEISNPTLAYKSRKTGKLVFAMKKIDYRGSLYYIFRIHEEDIEEEDKEAWEKAWKELCEMSRLVKIPLYDAQEIGERISEAIKDMKPWEGQRDVEIEIYDHSSGELHIVTKGVTLGGTKVVS